MGATALGHQPRFDPRGLIPRAFKQACRTAVAARLPEGGQDGLGILPLALPVAMDGADALPSRELGGDRRPHPLGRHVGLELGHRGEHMGQEPP